MKNKDFNTYHCFFRRINFFYFHFLSQYHTIEIITINVGVVKEGHTLFLTNVFSDIFTFPLLIILKKKFLDFVFYGKNPQIAFCFLFEPLPPHKL